MEKGDILRIRMRRYYLQRTAIEIYLSDGTSIFMNFPRKDRKVVLQHILRIRPPNLGELYRSPEEELRKTNLTDRWKRNEVSNFEYLMELNDISGRSYNDTSQYYVFPWSKDVPIVFFAIIAVFTLIFLSRRLCSPE